MLQYYIINARRQWNCHVNLAGFRFSTGDASFQDGTARRVFFSAAPLNSEQLLARCGNTSQESHVGRLGSTPVGRPSDQPSAEPPALGGPALTPVAPVRVDP